MAATNTTEYLGLGQYVANDKPSFLGTYNSDMRTIDEFAEDIATRMGIVESEVNGATEDLSGVHESINTLNSEVNELIERTANLSQDETQINNNTSAINTINQSITNINGSITELAGDIATTDEKINKLAPIIVGNFDSEDGDTIPLHGRFNTGSTATITMLLYKDDVTKYLVASHNTGTTIFNIEKTYMDANNQIRKVIYNYNFTYVIDGDSIKISPVNNKYGTVTTTIYETIEDPSNPGSYINSVVVTTTVDITELFFNYLLTQI